MRRFSSQVIYQIGFAASCLLCTIFSFMTVYKLNCEYTNGTSSVISAHMADYGRVYNALVILALLAGVVSIFIYFNKAVVVACGILLCGVGIKFMTYADSLKGQIYLVTGSTDAVVNMLGDVLDALSGQPMVIQDKLAGEFTAWFFAYMISAVASLFFGIMCAVFIKADRYSSY